MTPPGPAERFKRRLESLCREFGVDLVVEEDFGDVYVIAARPLLKRFGDDPGVEWDLQDHGFPKLEGE